MLVSRSLFVHFPPYKIPDGGSSTGAGSSGDGGRGGGSSGVAISARYFPVGVSFYLIFLM